VAAFKEMDPDLIRKALEGQVDVLTPLRKKEEALFRNASCPMCSSKECEEILNAQTPFTEGVPLPNKHLRCSQCRTEFDPYSMLITRITDESD
jgi:hypothetical protein